VLIATAQSGKEVIAVFLEQGGAKVIIIEKVVKAVTQSRKDIMAVLLKQ